MSILKKIKLKIEKQILNFKLKYRGDKFSTIFVLLSYVLFFFVVLTILLFSETADLNLIPKIFSILFSVSIFVLLIVKGKIYINYYTLSFLLFVVYSIVITLVTTKHLPSLQTIVNVYFLSFVVSQFIIHTKEVERILKIVLAAIFIFAVVFFITYSKNIFEFNFERMGSVFGNVNTSGIYFSIGVILSISLIAMKKERIFVLIIPILLFFFLGFTTGSKKAILIPLLSIIIGVYFLFPKEKKFLYFIFVILIIVLFYIILNLPFFEDYKIRIVSLLKFILTNESSAGDGSTVIRFEMLKDGLLLWTKNILFGYGAEGFRLHTGFGSYSHSNFTELLCNYGLIGFILFYGPLGYSLINQKESPFYKFYIIFIFSFITISSFSLIFYDSKSSLIILSIVAASNFIHSSKKQNFVCFSIIKRKPYILIEMNPKINKINHKKIFRFSKIV